jgi:hypothetical protein
MDKRTVITFVVRVVFGSLLAIGACLFFLFDPFNWGVTQSRQFTWEKFASVKPGERIEKVIARLGPPVRRPYTYSVMTTDPVDPCVTGECKEYLFAGAKWGMSYREAIVIVDEKGYVTYAEDRQE